MSVEEHLARCLQGVAELAPRTVPLLEALGCRLAESVRSPIALPPFANSAMDGYAVHVEDVATATTRDPVELPVADDVPAGPARELTLSPGQAVRVMTGAPIPAGTGAVVPVEWTDGGTDRVRIHQAPAAGQFLRAAGEDVEAGEEVLRPGVRLTARRIGLAAAVGRAELRVHPRPRVVVVSTGSELVPPGQALGFGQIYDSNGYALIAAAIEAGATARYAGFVGDDEEAVLTALTAAGRDADLLITSGGVSAGAHDPVKAALRRVGGVWFGPVAMQPGMPQGHGTYGPANVPVITLPGNPVSSMVSFEVFVRPVLLAMQGADDEQRPRVRARAAIGWNSPAAKRQFVRAVLDQNPDQNPEQRTDRAGGSPGWRVTPVGAQGSHLVADLAEATCLAVVPEDVTRVEPGQELECIVLDGTR